MDDKAPVSASMPGHLIRRLHQLATKIFMDRVQAAGFDLTPVQFATLDALRHSAGIDQAGLADMIAKDRATTGAVVDRLSQKGLIERSISSRDKRSRELKLTPAGEETLTRMIPVVVALQDDMLPGLDAAEFRRFVELAGKVVGAARGRED